MDKWIGFGSLLAVGRRSWFSDFSGYIHVPVVDLSGLLEDTHA